MFRHVLLLRWSQEAPDALRREAHERLLELPSHINVIRGWQVAPHDASSTLDSTMAYDYVIIADFDSEEDYLTYRDHPHHLDVIEHYTGPFVEAAAGVQFHLAEK